MNATFRAWVYRLLFGVLLAALALVGLVPKPPLLEQVPCPDLAICFAAAWMLRRPDYTLVSLVILYTLLNEILYLQPLGLWSALVFVAMMFLRSQVNRVRHLPFSFEWLLFSVAVAAAASIYCIVLVFLFVPAPVIQQTAAHILMTILAYPAAALATNWIFRLRKSTSTEASLLESRN